MDRCAQSPLNRLGSDTDGAPLTFIGFNKGNGIEICAPRFAADAFVVGLSFNLKDPAPNKGHAGVYFRTAAATDGQVVSNAAYFLVAATARTDGCQ